MNAYVLAAILVAIGTVLLVVPMRKSAWALAPLTIGIIVILVLLATPRTG
jgi:membrane-bound ClpP family serine protease